MSDQETPQQQQVKTGDDYQPFDEPVNHREYSRPNISVSAEQTTTPIAEPTFQTAPISSGDAYDTLTGNGNGNSGGGGNAGAGGQKAPPPPPPINPGMNYASDEEKKYGAKQLAKMVIDGYSFVNDIANEGLKFSEKKLGKLQQDGEIDLTIPIPYDMDKTISAADFIRDHNEMMSRKFRVTPEFKKEVTPVLERVLEKRGAGLTDEQTLLYLFGKDIAIKTFQFVAVKRQMKDMTDMLREYTQALKDAGHKPTPPQPQPQQQQHQQSYTPPPQQSQPVYDMPQNNGYQYVEPEEQEMAHASVVSKRTRKTDPDAYFKKVGGKRGGGKNKANDQGVEEVEVIPGNGHAATPDESSLLD